MCKFHIGERVKLIKDGGEDFNLSYGMGAIGVKADTAIILKKLKDRYGDYRVEVHV